MSELVERLRSRRTPHYVHSPGETPRCVGYTLDDDCQAAADTIEEMDKRIAELTAVVRMVDALIQHQYTGTRDAMSALQEAALAAHDALGNPE